MESNTPINTAILGFGNPVRSDDAIGVYVVNELQKKLQSRDDVSVFDMGTSAFEVLFKLKGHQRMIIVDGVTNSGEPDGTLFCVPASEIKAHIQEDPMVFLHGMKWDQALSYARKIMGNEFPENEIKVYLVAISEIKLNVQLSERVKAAGDKLIQTILNDQENTIPRYLKEAVPNEKPFANESDVYLESSHICIKKNVAEKVFGSESAVLTVFYARDHSFMAAPAGEDLFKTIHKGTQQMLKSKNAKGDKSISIQEIFLDNDLDESDRNLEFTVEEAVHILKVKL